MMRAETYEKGQLIITEGERGSEAYVIERGWVEVFRAGPPELPLAVLGPGQIFGEMALITEDRRSASVRALEATDVGAVGREDFLAHLRAAPDTLLPFLRSLAERLRNMNGVVEELARRSAANREVVRVRLGTDAPSGHAATGEGLTVTMKGLTPQASEALNGRVLAIYQFPFRIGRRTSADDPFSSNELAIPDKAPWWISRSHCMLSHVDRRCFLIDRGSRLGTLVDGKMVGGATKTGRVELGVGEHEVRLGGALTPFRFSLVVAGAPSGRRRRTRRRT